MTAIWPTVGLLVNASVIVNTLRCNYFGSAKDCPCIWSQEDTLLMSLSGLVSEESRLRGPNRIRRLFLGGHAVDMN